MKLEELEPSLFWLHLAQCLPYFWMVDVKRTVEVFDFMLQCLGQQTLCLYAHFFSVFVSALYGYCFRTCYLPQVTGHTETAKSMLELEHMQQRQDAQMQQAQQAQNTQTAQAQQKMALADQLQAARIAQMQQQARPRPGQP